MRSVQPLHYAARRVETIEIYKGGQLDICTVRYKVHVRALADVGP